MPSAPPQPPRGLPAQIAQLKRDVDRLRKKVHVLAQVLHDFGDLCGLVNERLKDIDD